MIPVRCFTCNKVIANKWLTFLNMKEEGMSDIEIYKQLKLHRFCCKRMFASAFVPFTNYKS